MNKYCLATIVNHEEITSGIWKMELAPSEIARTAGPGQFIMYTHRIKESVGTSNKFVSYLRKKRNYCI